jgi:hypothetical protein
MPHLRRLLTHPLSPRELGVVGAFLCGMAGVVICRLALVAPTGPCGGVLPRWALVVGVLVVVGVAPWRAGYLSGMWIGETLNRSFASGTTDPDDPTRLQRSPAGGT